MEGWRKAETMTREVISEQTADVALWEGEISAIASRIPRKGRLILASGMAIRDADSYASKLPPDSECLVNRGVNGIDGLIATAAGVAFEDSTRQVRLLIGDLAFQHDLGSLATAAIQPNLDIVVINNGGGGIFEFLPIRQATDKFDRFFLTPQNLNIPAITAGFGIASYRCESASELELVLLGTKTGCRVTEVIVDRQYNVNIHKAIGSAVIARLDKEFLLEQVDGEGNATPGGGLEPGKRFSGH
jgi:2-succinyl-5-enolpyruvyl-6-hydroxy-3-cyclohexene-1-carboxylate synthase